MKISFVCLTLFKSIWVLLPCALFTTGCKHGSNGDPVHKPDYSYDTISKFYRGDFSKAVTGGTDLIFQDQTTYIAYNYCGSGEVKIMDHLSSDVFSVPLVYADCKKLFTSIKNGKVYLVYQNAEIWEYDLKTKQNKLFYDLNKNKLFRYSGLRIEEYKPGSDQQVIRSDRYIYFRVNQDFDDSSGIYSRYTYAYPIFAKFDLRSKKLAFFGKQPKEVSYNEYAIYSMMFDLYLGDTIVTSEAYSGKIELIDTKTGKVKTLVRKSRYDKGNMRKLIFNEITSDMKDKERSHMITEPNYEALYYNPYNRYYYRVFHPKMALKDKNGSYNTIDDKRAILMVFDRNFRLLDEVELPVRDGMVMKLLPDRKGMDFILPYSIVTGDRQISYDLFRIIHD